MSEEEMLYQLKSLIDDRNSFILNSSDDCEIFKKDKLALETVIEKNKELKSRIDKAIKIFNECKMLMPHEFDWEEQFDNAIKTLKGDSNE